MNRRKFFGFAAAAPLAAATVASAASRGDITIRAGVNANGEITIDAARKNLGLGPLQEAPLFDMAAYDRNARKTTLLDHFGWGDSAWVAVDSPSRAHVAAVTVLFDTPGDVLCMYSEYIHPSQEKLWMEKDLTDKLVGLSRSYNVRGIAINAFAPLIGIQKMHERTDNMVLFPCNRRTMTAPLDDLVNRVSTGRLHHDGDRVMRSHFNNTSVNSTGLPRMRAAGNSVSTVFAACMANALRLAAIEDRVS